MAISGTNLFSPDIAELTEEAFERAGLKLSNGYDLRTARRSIDFMLLEWQNRGINLWTVDEVVSATLVKGTASYTLEDNTIAVIEILLRENDGSVSTQTDFDMGRISRDVYSGIPNKLVEGRPIQVYIDRQVESVVATVWPVPDESSKYKLVYYRMRAMYDAGAGGAYNPDVPNRFWPALVSGLAYSIALKRPEAASRIQVLKQDYEFQFKMAADEDREKAAIRFYPGGYNVR